ncbi:MAG: lamin tail domain-containing protein, partial [Rudaea sp.]
MSRSFIAKIVAAIGCAVAANAAFAAAQMRITEFMYSGSDGEFVEFTNVGDSTQDMAGWSFDDDGETPGSVDLGGFGTLQPGESAILTEASEQSFRSAWNLCAAQKIIGGNSHNL